MKLECGETLGDLEPVYHLFMISSEFTLPEALTQCGPCVNEYHNRGWGTTHGVRDDKNTTPEDVTQCIVYMAAQLY